MSVFKVGSNKSSQNNFPSVRPTLDLDFANSKTLDPRITFTRASGGSYVGADGLIKYAGVNEPRFDHDPVTGESLGFLVEEARTNLLTYSEDLSQSAWTKSNMTVAVNVTTAPNGAATADKFVVSSDSVSTRHEISTSFGSNTVAVTFSVFLKAAEKTSATVKIGGNAVAYEVTINLLTGSQTGSTYTSNVISTSYSVSALPGNWYKVILTGTANSGYSITNGSIFEDSIGNGTSGIFIWGAQLEAGSFPTSYIPTEASSRTRAADVASITGTNFSSWYRQDEGTVVASASINTSGYLVNFYGASSTQNRIALLRNSSGRGQLVVEASAVVQAAISLSGGDSVAIPSRLAGAYKTDNFYIAQGSSFTGSDTSGSPDTSIYRAAIGSLASSSFANGTIARLAYYPVRLPDAQLQVLTR